MASVSEIKQGFLDQPSLLAEYLENWFFNIDVKKNYITFGRDEDSSPTGLCLYTDSNKDLHLTDYSRGINQELFAYLIDQKGEEFKDLMGMARSILGLSGEWYKEERVSAFGGIYDLIGESKGDVIVNTYDESILDRYADRYNIRFLHDGINFKTQDAFNVKFDLESNSIVFPIRNECGEIIGVKARVNDDHPSRLKYYYPIECSMGTTLFGYSHNYSELSKGTVMVFEAEKSVMQCYGMGIRNAVAMGSSSLSDQQITLLLSLMPKKIILAYDEGIERQVINNTAYSIYQYAGMREIEVCLIDLETAKAFMDIPSKSSPSDLGKDALNELLEGFVERIDEIG